MQLQHHQIPRDDDASCKAFRGQLAPRLIVDSFDHLFSLVDELEKWMRAGKLNNVAPGEPAVIEEDLKSFLDNAAIPSLVR